MKSLMYVEPDHPRLEQPIVLKEVISNYERELITQALEKSNGIQTRAAALLGTTRRILRYRMDKLGIDVPDRNHS
jgi:transcriptional regulator with GAF, ATPase, and Fis domain